MSNGRSVVVHWRNVIRDDPDLDRTASHVAHVLATYMDADGVADGVAKTTIARGAKLGRPDQKGNTAVDRALERLEAAGLLLINRSRGRRGYLYAAVIPRPDEGLARSKSLAQTRDNGYEIPRGADAKSLADRRQIPRPGVGEREEREEQRVITQASPAGKKTGRSKERPKNDPFKGLNLEGYDRA